MYIHELSRYAGRGIRITAVCDINTGRAEKTLKMNGVEAKIYGSDEEFFAAGRLADVLIIATQDKDHYGHAKRALELGYHLLLEKPVARTEEQMRELADMARERGRFVLVDAGIVQTLVGLMCGDDVDESLLTTLDTTLTSHHIGFGAEKSRLEQGASVVL